MQSEKSSSPPAAKAIRVLLGGSFSNLTPSQKPAVGDQSKIFGSWSTSSNVVIGSLKVNVYWPPPSFVMLMICVAGPSMLLKGSGGSRHLPSLICRYIGLGAGDRVRMGCYGAAHCDGDLGRAINHLRDVG